MCPQSCKACAKPKQPLALRSLSFKGNARDCLPYVKYPLKENICLRVHSLSQVCAQSEHFTIAPMSLAFVVSNRAIAIRYFRLCSPAHRPQLRPVMPFAERGKRSRQSASRASYPFTAIAVLCLRLRSALAEASDTA